MASSPPPWNWIGKRSNGITLPSSPHREVPELLKAHRINSENLTISHRQQRVIGPQEAYYFCGGRGHESSWQRRARTGVEEKGIILQNEKRNCFWVRSTPAQGRPFVLPVGPHKTLSCILRSHSESLVNLFSLYSVITFILDTRSECDKCASVMALCNVMNIRWRSGHFCSWCNVMSQKSKERMENSNETDWS